MRAQHMLALGVFALLAAISCAQGYGSAPEQTIEPPSPPAPPVFTGEACELDERVTCMCADGKSMGVRACIPSDASPTKGMLSECVSCTEIASGGSSGSAGRTGSMSSAQTASSAIAGRDGDGGQSGGGAGGAGQGGSGGKSTASGGSGGKSGASGSGGSAAAGSGGKSGQGGSAAGGSSGRAGGSAGAAAGSGGRGARCNCNTGCLLTGVFPCCHQDGSCGCTWAPGAYCM